MWSMSGSIAASGTFKLSYYIDTTGGQSGSPVYKMMEIIGVLVFIQITIRLDIIKQKD